MGRRIQKAQVRPLDQAAAPFDKRVSAVQQAVDRANREKAASGDPALAGAEPVGVVDLLPAWVLPVLGQIFVAVVLVAVWRGRRLGRTPRTPASMPG